MIKYKLREQHGDILSTVLKNRELTIEEANQILNPQEEVIQDPMDMKNMEIAIDKLKYGIDNKLKIGILVDPDADGYSSSSIIYHLIKTQVMYHNVKYFIHNKNKAHGFEESIVKEIIDSEIDLMIVPDAGSTKQDGIQQKRLVELGKEIIILDHHIVECESLEGVVIVNPHQEGDNTNKDICGCGVAYKFTQAYCRKYAQHIDHTQYIDLFALATVSDMMNLRNLENRMYLNVGSDKEYIMNQFLKELIYKKKLEGDYLTIEQLGFSVAPLINSAIRMGTKEERDLLFNAMSINTLVEGKGRKNFGAMLLASEEAVRICGNLKSRQDKLKKEGGAKVLERVREQNLLDNKILICDVTDILSPSLTGLAANQILNEIKRPMILLRSNDGINYTGSARNYGKAIEDFKEFCSATGLFGFTSGHAGAFGVSITRNNIPKVIEVFNEKLKDIEFLTDVEVDAIYEGDVPMEDIKSIAEYQDLWCHSIKEPQFLVKGIRIHTRDVKKVGIANYNFKYGNCSFTKNYGPKVWFEEFINPNKKLPFGGELEVEALCRFRKTVKGFYYIDIISATSNNRLT